MRRTSAWSGFAGERASLLGFVGEPVKRSLRQLAVGTLADDDDYLFTFKRWNCSD